MADKTYIDGIIIKQYGEFGSMNVAINLEEFDKAIDEHEKNGWLNVTIHKRREPTDKGITHYVVLDEHEPGNRIENF